MRRGDPPIFIFIFGRAATVDLAANFNYTTTPAICQEKSAKKIKKLFFTKPLDKSIKLCYN